MGCLGNMKVPKISGPKRRDKIHLPDPLNSQQESWAIRSFCGLSSESGNENCTVAKELKMR